MPVSHALALGILQGLTELLPISSSGHLIIVPWLLGWPAHSLTFDVALHMGTLLAIVGYFWRDWTVLFRAGLDSIRERNLSGPPERLLFWLILLGCIPGAVAGLLLEKAAETHFRNPYLIAADLSLMGLLLLWADRAGVKRRRIEEMKPADGAAIGLAQAVALIPGVSRSGITITSALALGLTREAAARYSFLLATPITFGAGLLKLGHLVRGFPPGEGTAFTVGCLASAAVGYLAILFLMDFVRTRSLSVFAYYRFLMTAVILITALARHG